MMMMNFDVIFFFYIFSPFFRVTTWGQNYFTALNNKKAVKVWQEELLVGFRLELLGSKKAWNFLQH